VGHDHTTAVQSLKSQTRACFLDQGQSPIQKKLTATGYVLGPKGDFIDAKNAHGVSLVKQCFQIETNKRLFALSACGSIQIRVQEQVFGKRTWE
jgi:hypothetical protein